MDPAAYPDTRDAIAADVRAILASNDASHDFGHIDRVRAMALKLARDGVAQDGLALDAAATQVIELGALLHDVADYKYTGSDEANASVATELLRKHGAPEGLIARVLRVVDSVSFSGELAGKGAAGDELPLEACIVQDADRLEAIGAIGIARCFTYSGAQKRPLHYPATPPLPPGGLTKDAYRDPSRVHFTINHFYEKLVTLRDHMKTAPGRRVANGRHAFMEGFLHQFHAEWASER